jgi:DNA-binding SARP family transcriptional activator
MEFRVLGPLEVLNERGVVALGGIKPRAVLAVLLLHPNEAVSAERLALALWGEDAAAGAVKTVQVHISRLRKALGDPERVATTPVGYCLRVGPGELDAERFELLVQDGRLALAAGEVERAAAVLRSALSLWRGPALEDVAYEPFAQTEIARLEEQRLAALEARVDADLASGHHAELLGELQQLLTAHPTRERLVGQLMLALYRCGRQAEALETYRGARQQLIDEVGVEPGPELHRLQEAILRHDASLEPLAAPSAPSHGVSEPAGGRAPPSAAGTDPAANGAPVAAPPPVFPMPAVTPRTIEGAFVGREACLEQMRSRWKESRDGHTSLVLLVGEPGMGKTRLATRFGDEVHGEGAAVLYGRADAERLHTYQPFAEALNHLVAHAGADFVSEVQHELEILNRLFPNLWPQVSTPTAPVDKDTLRYQVFEAVVSVLTRASVRWPLLLVLDDLHWADKLTLLLLRHVLRHAEGTRLLVVGTFRDVEVARDHPLIDLLGDLRRERRYDRLKIDGFDQEATHALVADRFGAEVTPAFVRRLREQTDGNVFFIEETVRALSDSRTARGVVVDADALEGLGVPEGVAEVIIRRAQQLSSLASTLLTAGSVVGPSFRLGIVEQLVDAGPDEVVAAVEESVTAGLVVEVPDRVDVFSFSHALVREVLYAQLTATRRVRLHHRVAKVLEQLAEREPVNLAELAHHFALARHLAGSAPARRYAIAAGRYAGEVFAYEEAAQHFRRALDLFEDHEDERQRCDVLLALGRVEWQAGDEAARKTFLAAAESADLRGDTDQLARAALGLSEYFFEVTYTGARYRDLLEKATAALSPSDSELRALLLSRLATNLAFPNEDERAHALAADAVAMARRLGDEKLLAAVLLARHVTLLDVRHVEQRLELSEEFATLSGGGGHQQRAAARHYWRMYTLLEVGDLDAARREHAELEASAGRLGKPLLRSIAAGARGLWAQLAGDIELAERCADEFLHEAHLAHTRDAVSVWASQLLALRRRQGRLAELMPFVERLADSGGHQLGWLSALGVLRFEAGDIEEARRICDEELRDGPGGLPRGMFWLTRVAMLSELCVMLGDVAGARGLYAELVPHAACNVVVGYSSVWGPVDGYLALLAQTFGDEALAARHANAALERTRAMNAPLLTQDLERRHSALIALD